MSDILTDIRQRLLTFSAVSDLVGDRIRPHEADTEDENSDVVILDLPDANQFNCLSGEAIVNGLVVVRTRSQSKATAAEIAEAVRADTNDDGLDGFEGPAGNGYIIQSERLEFSQYHVDDEDDDADGYYETESLYSIFYQTT